MTSSAMHTFNVAEWIENDHPDFVPLTQPRAVGCWTKESHSTGGKYNYGSTEGMPSYRPPKNLPVDLNTGYTDSYVKGPEDNESTPVEVIIEGAKQLGTKLQQVQICTFRNNLNKLLMTPISQQEEWTIDACYWMGTMFLDIVKTPQRDYPNSDLFCFYGYKFEAVCTSKGADGVGAATATVDSSSEFALMLRLKLGSHAVLMAAEVDCRGSGSDQGAGDLDPGSFMELKTVNGTGQVFFPFLEYNFVRLHANPKVRQRYLCQKYPKWWVQSFLGGVGTMVVGGRNDSGMLTEIFHVPVTELPSRAAAVGQGFDAWQLLRFGDSSLSWMHKLTEPCPGQHFRFRYDPQQFSIVYSIIEDGNLPARLAKIVTDGADDSS